MFPTRAYYTSSGKSLPVSPNPNVEITNVNIERLVRHSMQYVKLGRTGVKVSRICLGCMSFGNAGEWYLEIDKARPIVERALDLGINFFDTANAYSRGRSEEIIGELLKDRREEVIIATKIYFPMGSGTNENGLSRVHIHHQVRRSLERLQTDYIDLYQTHRWDYETPIEETLTTLNDLVRHGKVRYIGASSMHAWQFAKSLWTSSRLGLERFETMQNHYSLSYREEEREMIPLCHDQQIGLIPWSPLGGGLLTGKYKRGVKLDSPRLRADTFLRESWAQTDSFDVVERLTEVASGKGVTPSQVALAWLLERDVTSPIIGATKLSHVEEAVEAVDVHLSSSDVKLLEEPYKLQPISGHQ